MLTVSAMLSAEDGARNLFPIPRACSQIDPSRASPRTPVPPPPFSSPDLIELPPCIPTERPDKILPRFSPTASPTLEPNPHDQGPND